MTFTTKLEDLRNEAVDYIKSVLNKRGTNYELTDPTNYDLNEKLSDEIYKLPRGFVVKGEYSRYQEYPIVVVNIKDDILSFDGIAIMGDSDEDKIFWVDDLCSDALCEIATLISKLEN